MTRPDPDPSLSSARKPPSILLTLITVVLAVYLVVPWLMRIYQRYLAPRR